MSKARAAALAAVLALVAGILWWSADEPVSTQRQAEVPEARPDSTGQPVDDPLERERTSVASGEAREERSQAEERSGCLRGRVEDSAGRPIAGARVRWLALQQEDTELTPAWP